MLLRRLLPAGRTVSASHVPSACIRAFPRHAPNVLSPRRLRTASIVAASATYTAPTIRCRAANINSHSRAATAVCHRMFGSRARAAKTDTDTSSTATGDSDAADTDTSADPSAGRPVASLASSPYLIPPTTYDSSLNAGCWLAARALAAKYEQAMKRLQSNRGDLSRVELSRLHKEKIFLGPAIECLSALISKRKELVDLDALLIECTKDKTMKDLIADTTAERESVIRDLLAGESELLGHLLPRNRDDHRNAILELRAGTGGDEAAIFAGDMFRMYERFCARMGWRFELLHSNRSGDGVKEASALISGTNVFASLRHESGVHRVQRVPLTEANGRIHTSTMTVAIMPEAAEVDIEIDDRDLRIDTYRAGGNGGQHVNKTDSAVRITHVPSGLVIAIQDERSQHQNKAKAMKILRARLYEQKRREEDERSADLRKSQVSSAERSDRIRTYNYPQSRITDHRVHFSRTGIEAMMAGDLLADFHAALVAAERLQAMIALGFAKS